MSINTRLARLLHLLLFTASLQATAGAFTPDEQNRGNYPEPRIAPLDQAITLARTQDRQILLVLSASFEGVEAITLPPTGGEAYQDTISAYQAMDRTAILALAQTAEATHIPWSALSTPIAHRATAIAAGTNYSAHAEEVNVEDGPFLFPKLARPSSWNTPVHRGARLDYEVELCAFPLSDFTRQSTDTAFSFALCGDFTDRWVLLRDMDFGGEMGRSGFPTGKSGETRFPLGPLMLFPQRADFYRDIRLTLYVNGEKRQEASANQMIWSPQDILANALSDCLAAYRYQQETISIASCEGIAAGTPLLTGTPEGVIFRLYNLWSPWAYLGEGDEVTSFATYLGFTRNPIAPTKQ